MGVTVFLIIVAFILYEYSIRIDLDEIYKSFQIF